MIMEKYEKLSLLLLLIWCSEYNYGLFAQYFLVQKHEMDTKYENSWLRKHLDPNEVALSCLPASTSLKIFRVIQHGWNIF